MMMKNKGYTLAETLVALGIIGVVSAMTIPFISNISNERTSASNLSKAVSDIETAFTTAMAAENAPDIFATSFWPNGNNALSNNSTQALKNRFNGNFTKYLTFTPLDKSVTDIYNNNRYFSMNNDGKQGPAWNDCNNDGACRMRNNYAVKLKNASFAYFQLIPRSQRLRVGQANAQGNMNNITEREAMSRGTTLRCVTGWVFIDTNGPKEPNIVGRDIFGFAIGQNGVLYPYGGSEYANFEEGAANSLDWRSENGNYSCTNNSKKVGGLGCTGRIVEEGYKITY